MRSRTLPTLPGRCPTCYLKEAFCLCAELPRVETRFEVLVLRHAREAAKSTNTARIAALAMPNASVLAYDGPSEQLDARVRALTDPWLLYPGAAPAPPGSAPKSLVVLDGTWRQTRRMLRRVGGLDELPRLSLPRPAQERTRLRRSPSLEGVSTLEALAAATALLEGPEAGDKLFALQARMVERVLAARGLGAASAR